jgi:hypothetical protein
MINIVEQVFTVASLASFGLYIIITDVKENIKLKGGK